MPPTKPVSAVEYSETGVPLHLLTAADLSPFLLMALYGDSGVGKTTLATSAVEVPELAPVLLLDFGNSSDSVLGEERFSNVHVMRLRTIEDANNVYNWLLPVEWGGEGHCAEYKTVVIDELDEFHSQRMREVMTEAVRKDPSRELYVASQREWGIVRSMVLEFVDHWRVLPLNLIFTFVPNMKENEVTGRERVTIGLPGKLSNDIAKRLSMLVYLEVAETAKREGGQTVITSQRVARFASTGKFVAKVRGISRASRLGDTMLDPTMSKIYSLYKGE